VLSDLEEVLPNLEEVLPKLGEALPNLGEVLPNLGEVLPNLGEWPSARGEVLPDLGEMLPESRRAVRPAGLLARRGRRSNGISSPFMGDWRRRLAVAYLRPCRTGLTGNLLRQ
jgi:hypothetical protein